MRTFRAITIFLVLVGPIPAGLMSVTLYRGPARPPLPAGYRFERPLNLDRLRHACQIRRHVQILTRHLGPGHLDRLLEEGVDHALRRDPADLASPGEQQAPARSRGDADVGVPGLARPV